MRTYYLDDKDKEVILTAIKEIREDINKGATKEQLVATLLQSTLTVVIMKTGLPRTDAMLTTLANTLATTFVMFGDFKNEVEARKSEF